MQQVFNAQILLSWPVYKRWLFIALVNLLVIYVLYCCLIKTCYNKKSLLRNELMQLQKNFNDRDFNIKQWQNRSNYDNTIISNSNLMTKIENRKQEIKRLEKVTHLTKQYGLQINQIKPIAGNKEEINAALQVTAVAAYYEMVRFLNNIIESPNSMLVEKLMLLPNKKNKDGKQNLSLFLEII